MQRVEAKIDLLAGGWSEVSALIPPRACGAHNTGCAERIKGLAEGVTPGAFDPLPEAVAVAATRDLLTREPEPGESEGMCYSPNFDGPPNCEGNKSALPRASFPPFDDDFGGPAEPARYPPGVACNVTGECE